MSYTPPPGSGGGGGSGGPGTIDVKHNGALVGSNAAINIRDSPSVGAFVGSTAGAIDIEMSSATPMAGIGLTHSANQSIANATDTMLAFNTITLIGHSGSIDTTARVLTGTVSKQADPGGTTTITGVGTFFLTEVNVGNVIVIGGGGGFDYLTVTFITDHTHLFVAREPQFTASGITAHLSNQTVTIMDVASQAYEIAASVTWAGNATGRRIAYLKSRDAGAGPAGDAIIAYLDMPPPDGNTFTMPELSAIVPLSQWDFIELHVQQTSGGALNVLSLAEYSPRLSVTYRTTYNSLGAAPNDATYITANAHGTLTNESTLASVIARGTLASRPAAGLAGRLYYDTTNSILYRDNGTGWDNVEGATGGGGGAPDTAPYIVTSAVGGLSAEVLLSNVIMRGTLASRPAASIAGRLYYVTDTSTLYRDNQISWDAIEGAGSAGAPADATYITTTANATLSAENLLSAVIGRGTVASRPAFGVAGRLYYGTDTSILYRDSGAAWENVEGSGVAAHTILSTTHTDVDATDTPASGDVLTWDSGTSKWLAAPAPGAGTGAPTTSPYITYAADATLTSEKVLGTDIVPVAAYASRPAAGTAGRIFFPTDAPVIQRDTGSAWESRGLMGPPFVTPVNSGFSWVNQGTATLTDYGWGLHLRAVATGTGALLHIRTKSAPATPYTLTAYVEHLGIVKNFLEAGIGWRQSSDGKLVTMRMLGHSFFISKYNSATSFSADYIAGGFGFLTKGNWIRISDDGTNRRVYVSPNGVEWVLVHTIGRTDFLTANELFFYANSENSATPNLDGGCTLYSWQET